jgi:membrane-associated phospholipid phosphatase
MKSMTATATSAFLRATRRSAPSLGVSTAMTATLEGSPAAPWLWGAAAIMSVSAASLRMMAEKHYFTDVTAGAAIGAACGVVLALLHRRGARWLEARIGCCAGSLARPDRRLLTR